MEETGEADGIIVAAEVEVTRPEPVEAAAAVVVTVVAKTKTKAPGVRSTARCRKVKLTKCVTAITLMATRLGTAWLQQPVLGSTKSSQGIENLTSLEEIKRMTLLTTRCSPA